MIVLASVMFSVARFSHLFTNKPATYYSYLTTNQQPTNQPNHNQQTYQPTNPTTTNQQTYQPNNQSTNQQTNQPTD